MAQGRFLEKNIKKWSKDEHIKRMHTSGYFRYTKEISIHHVEEGNAERFLGLVLGDLVDWDLTQELLEELGIHSLQKTFQDVLGEKPIPWYFSYRVRLGIK